MQDYILVSVIITTYGRSDFLEKAIKSVIAQTYKNIEIIIVDDNAQKEDIRQEVQTIVARYPQCTLIINKTNLGGSLARNEGIKASQGELISFLDDDDTYFPTRIEKCVKAFSNHKNENIGIIFHHSQSVTTDGKKLGEHINLLEKKTLAQLLKISCIAATSQWVVPRYSFEQVGMFEDTPCKQDSIMMLKILGGGLKPLCVNEILSNYTVHQEGKISGNPQRNIVGITNYHNWAKKYYSQLQPAEIKNAECRFAKDLIRNHSMLNQRKKAIAHYRVLLKYNPLSTIVIFATLQIALGSTYFNIIQAIRRIGSPVKRLIKKHL